MKTTKITVVKVENDKVLFYQDGQFTILFADNSMVRYTYEEMIEVYNLSDDELDEMINFFNK
jgi:hypothetical protein